MKFYDQSARTAKHLQNKRSKDRRGVVIYTTPRGLNAQDIQDGRLFGRIDRCMDYHIAPNGNVSQLSRGGYYVNHGVRARDRYHQDSDYTLNHTYVGIGLQEQQTIPYHHTDLQYGALAYLIRCLVRQHEYLAMDAIKCHYEVVVPRGAANDPMVFDWPLLTRHLLVPDSADWTEVPIGSLS